MKTLPLFAVMALATSPVWAEEPRQVDAHEHGVGQLNIAFDGNQIAIELHAPGSDIVGFEYAAESSADRAAVDAAVAKLAVPLDLFVLPTAAECSVVQASAELESEDAHEEDHDGHDEEHEEESGHTEFHAEYLLTCAKPNAASEITFTYFKTFPNALELEVQVVSDAGANAFEVERDNPKLDLRGMF